MKKLGFLASILMLVGVVMLVTPQPQPAQADPGFSQICKSWLADNPVSFNEIFESHGDCVSTFQAVLNNGNTDPVGFCKSIEGPPFIPGAFKNLGDCISFIRHLINE